MGKPGDRPLTFTYDPSREGSPKRFLPSQGMIPGRFRDGRGFFMHAVIGHIALILLAALPLRAGVGACAEHAPSDSEKVYRYDEIVISAERYPVSARKAGAVAYEVDGLGHRLPGGPGDALAGMRNLHMLRYGGGMSLQTLSVRGMGSEHTLVLWNGMPAGNMQTGVSDFNLISAAALDAIQVVPGGASALHGSGAVGGVVNLLPAIPYSASPGIDIGTGSGSFGESAYSVRGEVNLHPSVGMSVRAGRSRSRGDFAFHDPSGGREVTRLNSDFLSQSMTVAAGWRNGEDNRLGLVVTVLALDQGTPGPWLSGEAGSQARRNDRRYVAGLSFEHTPPGRIGVTAAAIFDRQYERFLDRNGPFPADNHYQTTWTGFSGQFRYQASPAWLFQAGTDVNLAVAGGNAIDRTTRRHTAALSGSFSCTLPAGDGITASITPSGRFEGSSTFRPHFSPKLGLNLEMERNGFSARFHSTAGTGRRNPTMNELYYSGEGGLGNPALKGETSVSFDAGIGGTVDVLGGIGWDATYYHIKMEDRIQWTPTDNPRIWSPRNIGRTRSTGWEFSGEWKILPGELELRGDYSIIDAKRGSVVDDGTMRYVDRLIYIPLDKGSVGILLGRREITSWFRALSIGLRAIHTGERFILDDNSITLPSQQTLDGSITAEFVLPGSTATVIYSARNLDDSDYEVMPGYPMPRFNHSLTIFYRISI